MKDRNRALKKAAKTKLEIDRKNARTIRNLANQYIKKARSDYIQDQLVELKDKPKKVLEHTKRHSRSSNF